MMFPLLILSIFKMMTLFILALSTIMAFSAMSGFSLWLSLELNMMSFMPLINWNSSKTSTKSMMKYFIIQSFASSIFILCFLIQAEHSSSILNELLTFTLITKLGMAPMHFWFPDVSESLPWVSLLLLLTWQKLIPLFILSQYSSQLIWTSILMSGWISCLSMLNLTSLRKIMALSSINNLSWMAFSLTNFNSNWILFFIVYSIIIMMISFLMKEYNMSSIFQLYLMKNMEVKFLILLLSLGGLPPLMGFFPKWLILSSHLTSMNFIGLNLIMTSLISLSVYTMMVFPLIFKSQSHKKWNSNFFLIELNMFGLFFCSPLIIM